MGPDADTSARNAVTNARYKRNELPDATDMDTPPARHKRNEFANSVTDVDTSSRNARYKRYELADVTGGNSDVPVHNATKRDKRRNVNSDMIAYTDTGADISVHNMPNAKHNNLKNLINTNTGACTEIVTNARYTGNEFSDAITGTNTDARDVTNGKHDRRKLVKSDPDIATKNIRYRRDFADADTDSPVRNAVMTINARCTASKRRKDLDMVHKKQSITIYNIEDDVEFPASEAAGGRRARAYRVVPCDRQLEERCELIKSTYDVITKYTRAMFDKQNETVV